MAGSKARTARQTSRPGTQSRDKGTRGGRPEPQVTGKAPAARAGSPARVDNRARAASPARAGNGPAARAGGVTASTPAVRPVPAWLVYTTWALAAAGLGVSTYLTVAHYTTSSILACSDKGLVNCAAVTTSPESMVFGVFPVAVLGLAFYVFLFAITSPWAWRWAWPPVRLVRLGSLVLGMLFVLYLVYTELITLNAICLWCSSVHVLTFALFGLVVFGYAAGYGAPEPAAHR